MNAIKIYDGINVTLNGKKKFYPDMTALDFLRIQDELRIEVIRSLMAFRRLDITQAYGGYYKQVLLEVVPAKD